MKRGTYLRILKAVVLSGIVLVTLSCGRKSDPDALGPAAPVPAEVLTLYPGAAELTRSFPASIQGKDNVQLRPQISGAIDRIYVDEGAFVTAGQPLFRINSSVYREQKNTALATLGMTKSQLASAKLELDKYQVLTDNKVVADFQFRKAKTNYESALAAVKQQQALVAAADLNLGFATVRAPIGGYIGRIPNRVGALVSPTDTQPLTTLSQVSEIYVYFSLPEKDILTINATRPGKTLLEKLKSFQGIRLLLADGNPYGHSGKIDMMDGQFDANTGSVSLRASFSNPEGLLRTGNTGRIELTTIEQGMYKIPLLATYELQDKLLVGLIDRQNRVVRKALDSFTKSGNFYLLRSGFAPGDRIVANELAAIPENAVIVPKTVQ